MTTPSKTNKPTSLEGVKREFEKAVGQFRKMGFIISLEVKEYFWSFISQQISQAEERGYKRGWNKKVVAHRTIDNWCCACGADIAEMEQKIKEAEERGEKRIIDKIYPRLYSLWANIDFVHNRSAREQAKELVKLLESLTHKSTKQSKEVNR